MIRALVATPQDAAAVVETITLAFHDDPVWSWAFPDAGRRAGHYREWWALGVASSIAQGAVWMTDPAAAATAVWVPPGGSELLPEDEPRVEPMLREQLGDAQTDEVLELLRRFDAHHPDERFHYLSLLATHPDHRGRGLGIGLLAARLAELDTLGEPSLLESSNPVNNTRYARLGYRQIDEFHAPSGGPPIAVMWRDPR
jgi:GNAT superfamily N-acetyltransferase